MSQILQWVIFTERYPLHYFILVGVPNCVFVIFLYIYIYVLITYFCMFKFYFDYLFALSIVFYCRKLNFKTWAWCAVVSFPLIVGQFFSCVATMDHPATKMPLAYLFSKMIKYNVKGATYILYTIIFKYLCYNMHLFWMVKWREI